MRNGIDRACGLVFTEDMTTTSQIVIRYPDSRYVVRTYEAHDDRWVLVRETPASYRDVAQATIDGKVADAESQ